MEKKGEKGGKILPGYPRTKLKILGFFHRLHPGIFYPWIFQESKSRDIPGPGYPVDIPTSDHDLTNINSF